MDDKIQKQISDMLQQAAMGSQTPVAATAGYGLFPAPNSTFATPDSTFPTLVATAPVIVAGVPGGQQ